MTAPSDPTSRSRRPVHPRLDDGYLSPETTSRLARVAPTSLPILCLDCVGPAFARVAGLIHAESRHDRLILVDLRATRDALLAGLIRANASPRATLAVDGIELLDRDEQVAFLRSMERDAPRLVSGSLVPLEELRDVSRPEFFALVSTVTVVATSLGRRGPAIEDFANRQIDRLCVDLGRAPARLSTRAITALGSHSWPGDVAELVAVLARTLLDSPGDTIDAEDLRWSPAGGDRTPGVSSASPESEEVTVSESPGSAESPQASTPDPLESDVGSAEAIAVELAHQIKNPLVTVKTFVQNIAHLSSDAVELARFRDLTDEAISRMDGVIDETLRFARLGPPQRTHVEVVELLRESLREMWDSFSTKEVKDIRVSGPNGASLHAVGDPEHLRIAFRALVRHLQETIEPRSDIHLGIHPPGEVTLCYRESGTSTHLRGVAGLSSGSFPLALLLVRGALARVGSRIDVTHDGGQVRIALNFASV